MVKTTGKHGHWTDGLNESGEAQGQLANLYNSGLRQTPSFRDVLVAGGNGRVTYWVFDVQENQGLN